MLRQNLENRSPSRSPTKRIKSKIEHQIDNEGCKCNLCQKIVFNKMKVVQKYFIEDK